MNINRSITPNHKKTTAFSWNIKSFLKFPITLSGVRCPFPTPLHVALLIDYAHKDGNSTVGMEI
jgi:hypothetical protein